MCQWKNFENRSIFDEDIDNHKVGQFFWDTVYIGDQLAIKIKWLTNKHNQLGIWGRAQRKAAQRRKSDWGDS